MSQETVTTNSSLWKKNMLKFIKKTYNEGNWNITVETKLNRHWHLHDKHITF